MKLTNKTLYVVKDPGPLSELCDIFFDMTLDDLFQYYNGNKNYEYENHQIYDDPEEALTDAKARLIELVYVDTADCCQECHMPVQHKMDCTRRDLPIV